jgi:hypothetical protein
MWTGAKMSLAQIAMALREEQLAAKVAHNGAGRAHRIAEGQAHR